MKKLFASAVVVLLALTVANCAGVQKAIDEAKGIYTFATTTTVPSSDVGIVANAFDGLKGTAVNYGNYCVARKFPQPQCSASNRRTVIKAINTGTAARVQLEASITSGQPATATLYNALVAAVNALQQAPINVAKGQ